MKPPTHIYTPISKLRAWLQRALGPSVDVSSYPDSRVLSRVQSIRQFYGSLLGSWPKLPPIFLFLLLIFSCGAAQLRAQNTQVQQSPDCVIYFSVPVTPPGTTTTTGLANYGPGSVNGGNLCTNWVLGYASEGFSTYDIVVQSAPAATYTTPGTWVTYAGTVTAGSNPTSCNTACNPSQGQIVLANNGAIGIPWIRVAIGSTTGSGALFGILMGWNAGNAGSGGSGGGGSGGCPGTVATPCVTGSENSSALAVTDGECDNLAPITISSASGLQQIITGSAGKSVYLCHLSISNATAVTVQVESGAGSNCAGATTAMSGAFQNVATMAFDFTSRTMPPATSGQNVCLNFGGTTTAGGWATYALR
jgi:hypothetical protein